jgi:hypothetical protein
VESEVLMETDIIWLLLFIGYAIGLIPIAYFGIVGTNDIINFKNRQYKQEQIRQIGLSKAFEKAKENAK